MRVLFCVVVVLMSLASPAWAAVEPKPIKLEVGQAFEISLETGQTAGFEWQLAKPLEPKTLKLLGVDYPQPGGGDRSGKGTEIWRFKAMGPGKVDIQFKYVRPLLSRVKPARTTNFVFMIEAKKEK